MKNNKQPFHRKTSLIPRKSRLCATKTPEGDETIRKTVAKTLQKTTHDDSTKYAAYLQTPPKHQNRQYLEIALAEQLSHPVYSHRFLLFDTDRLKQSPERDREMKKPASQNKLTLVRQDKCFESVLLRHFQGHETAHPMTSADALSRLEKIWPDYRKGVSAIELGKQIGLSDIRRAAKSSLNSDLATLLGVLGLMPLA